MNRSLTALIAGVALSIAQPMATPRAQSTDEILLKQAIDLEKAKGDVKGAIEIYKKLAQSKDPKLSALARRELVRLQVKPAAAQPVWRQQRLDLPVEVASPGRVSADGRFLTAVENNNLMVVDLSSGSKQVLVPRNGTAYPSSSAWTSDGQQIVFVWNVVTADGDIQSEVRVAPRRGGQGRSVSSLRAQAGTALSVSADGRYIAINTATWTSDRLIQDRLLIVSLAHGAARVIKTFPPHQNLRNIGIGRAAFSPDGAFLAYDVVAEPNQRRAIAIVDVNNSQEAAMDAAATASDSIVEWSPDGNLIFLRENNALAHFVAGGRVQGAARLIARDVGSVRSLGFSSDRRLHVLKTVAGHDVYVASVDPASGRVVEQPQLLNRPQPDISRGSVLWSPDGQRIAFAKSGGMLVVQNLTSRAERVYALSLQGGVSYPSWEPGGHAIVFRSADSSNREGLYRLDLLTEKVEFLEPGYRMLFAREPNNVVVPVAQNNVVVRQVGQRDDTPSADRRIDMQGPGNPMARSLDGKLLAVYVPAERAIAIVPVDGGPRKTLVSGFPNLLSTNFVFSPDGLFVYFVAAD